MSKDFHKHEESIWFDIKEEWTTNGGLPTGKNVVTWFVVNSAMQHNAYCTVCAISATYTQYTRNGLFEQRLTCKNVINGLFAATLVISFSVVQFL